MNRAEEILRMIVSDVEDSARTVKSEMTRSGKKAVGCMLEFCPEELVYAGGMLPVGLWGGKVELNRAKRYFPTFFCAPVQQSLELALQGAYDGVLSAVVVPILCDTLKSAGQNWRVAVPDIPMIPVVYPQNRRSKAGRAFLRHELSDAKKKLEQVCGRTIGDEDISRAIELYNRYRLALRAFAREAAFHGDVVPPSVRHSVFQCGFYLDKKDYVQTLESLTGALRELPRQEGRRRVALTGIALDSPRILEAMDKNGLTVTADTLAQESGQNVALVPEGDDPLDRLAGWWGEMGLSSLAVDQDKERVEHMIRLVRQGQADGVIIAVPSFCDPEEYDYPIFRSAFEQAGVRHLLLELSGQSTEEQARARIQAFAELLS